MADELTCPTCGCDGRRVSQDRKDIWFIDFECGANMWEGEPETLEEAPACYKIAELREKNKALREESESLLRADNEGWGSGNYELQCENQRLRKERDKLKRDVEHLTSEIDYLTGKGD